MFLLAIAAARHSIYLTNPYFIPDAAMRDALVRAAGRGVRVVVLVPGVIDYEFLLAAERRSFSHLLKAGVEIFEYQPALLHAKTLVIDGLWSTVGSANFDNRSFALNQELNLVMYDIEVAARLERDFAEDLRYSRKITYREWRKRGLWERFLELFVAPSLDLL